MVTLATLQSQREGFVQDVLTKALQGLGLSEEQRITALDKLRALSALIGAQDLFEFTRNLTVIQRPDSRMNGLFASLHNALLLITNRNIARMNCVLDGVSLEHIEDTTEGDLYPARCVDRFMRKLSREERAEFNNILERGFEFAEALRVFREYLRGKVEGASPAVGPAPMAVSEASAPPSRPLSPLPLPDARLDSLAPMPVCDEAQDAPAADLLFYNGWKHTRDTLPNLALLPPMFWSYR
jgi:hypothetical protein